MLSFLSFLYFNRIVIKEKHNKKRHKRKPKLKKEYSNEEILEKWKNEDEEKKLFLK